MRMCHILGVPPSDPGSQLQSFSLRPRDPDPTVPQTQELTAQPSSADQGLYLRVERVVIICVIVVITGV